MLAHAERGARFLRPRLRMHSGCTAAARPSRCPRAALAWLAFLSAASALAAAALPVSDADVLQHLTRTLGWYHLIGGLEQLQVAAEDVIARDRLHEQALTSLRLAFAFARACAALEGRSSAAAPGSAPQGSPSTGLAGQLEQAGQSMAQRIAGLNAQLADLDAQLAQARAHARPVLAARRADLQAALELLRAVQTSIAEVQRFGAGSAADERGSGNALAAQIADLQKTVPEARRLGPEEPASPHDASGPAASPGAATATAAGTASHTPAPLIHPESAGIIALGSEWFALHAASRQLAAALRDTDELIEELAQRRGAVGHEARAVVATALAAGTGSDPAQLLAQRQTLEGAEARFRQLATLLVPLGEQGLMLEAARSTLQEWRNALTARAALASRYLLLRAGLLIGSVLAVLGISEIWRRATFRYLHDARRRRQFLLLRRIAVGIALTLVLVFGLVSEVGSVATYIGFVTAGLAVALQNVILAVVAYFFLVGRYGVRVGDRITLAGVTGRVVDIGLLRMNLMELSGPDLHATGRVVVLSNAVLFQPAALFKQIPGADYVWHSVTLTLAAQSDVELAQHRLQQAAAGVYATYRAAIEQQHLIARQFIDFDTSAPEPQVRVHLSASGLECEVRYPVLPEHSAAIDQQMLQSLRGALAQDPQLTLVGADPVRLDAGA